MRGKCKITHIIIPALFLLLVSCAETRPLHVDFSPDDFPSAPDYSDPYYWCALPDKVDSADHIPADTDIPLYDRQASAVADVFFIHPTTYFGTDNWNADLHDQKVNTNTDTRPIRNQASVFNGCCRVYAPRYRQVSYHAYFSLQDSDAHKAFELAYSDVKAAFQYYLAHYNQGRPIIIASHSQGTTMAKWLLRDFFDGKPLQKQLVCAYLIGMPVFRDEFTSIPPCDSARQTGCYVSWRSFLEGNLPKTDLGKSHWQDVVVTNPLTYTRDTTLAPDSLNAGGLGRDANTIYPHVCSARIHQGVVWVSRPDIPGKAFIPKNLHVADYNLYWLSIRENAEQRVEAFETAASGK